MHHLSGGEKQRYRPALVRKPELLVLDEPAQADNNGQAALYELIRELDELHCGVIMISHDLHP